MTTVTETAPLATTRTEAWDRSLVWSTALVVVADIAVQVLAQAVIPPLAIVTLLALVGLGLFRVKRRAGIAVLGGLALLWMVGSLGFSFDHLQHPESGIDFVHAVIEVFGRLAVVVAAVGAWRGAEAAGARRVALATGAVLVAGILVGAVATAARSTDQAQPGDVTATIEHAEFPDMAVTSGESLFVSNRDLFRHTLTVEGTGLDVELPAKAGVRVPIDLPAGTYSLICTVPGHEFMQGTLDVG